MSYRVNLVNIAPAQLLCLFTAALLIVVGLLHLGTGYGDQLPDRRLILSRAAPGIADIYTLGFTLPNPQTLGSIKLQFCSEGPLIGTPCTAPVGFDATIVTLAVQAGESGFTVSNLTNTNTIILTRTPAVTTASGVVYEMGSIANPSNSGTFYARLETFATADATGPNTDSGGMALSINEAVSVSATVPPYLYFCIGVAIANTDCTTATGDYINFGEFTTVAASTAQTQMVAGTNGPTGYAITVGGSTLTSGINTIPALSVPDVSRPGTSQFGINLVANADPSIGENPSGGGSGQPTAQYVVANQYTFVPGDVVASVPQPDLPRKYTTSYVTNIAKTQESGIYVSTLTYVATAGF